MSGPRQAALHHCLTVHDAACGCQAEPGSAASRADWDGWDRAARARKERLVEAGRKAGLGPEQLLDRALLLLARQHRDQDKDKEGRSEMPGTVYSAEQQSPIVVATKQDKASFAQQNVSMGLDDLDEINHLIEADLSDQPEWPGPGQGERAGEVVGAGAGGARQESAAAGSFPVSSLPLGPGGQEEAGLVV